MNIQSAVRVEKVSYVRTTARHGIDDAEVRRIKGFQLVELGTGKLVGGIHPTRREAVIWAGELNRRVVKI